MLPLVEELYHQPYDMRFFPRTNLRGGEIGYIIDDYHCTIVMVEVSSKLDDWFHSSILIPVRSYGKNDLNFISEDYIYFKVDEAINVALRLAKHKLKNANQYRTDILTQRVAELEKSYECLKTTGRTSIIIK